MAIAVFTRRPGRIKPASPLMLNQSMPDARGLRVFFAVSEQGGGVFVNLASQNYPGFRFAPSSLVIQNSLYGGAVCSNNASDPTVTIGYTSFIYPTAQITLGCLHQYDPSLGNYLFGFEGTNTGGGCFVNSTTWRPYISIAGSFSDPGNGVLPNLASGETHWVWLTFDGVTVRDYQDGVLYFSDNKSGAISQPTALEGIGLGINGKNDTNTTGSAHRVIQFRLYDRALGQDEIREIETEPWRAVTPAARARTYFSTSVAGAAGYLLVKN